MPYRWHKAVDKVQAALPGHVSIQPWKMHIFSQLPYPDNYKLFKQRRGQPLKPLEAPKRLPALPSGLDAGQVPSVAELKAAVAAAYSGGQTAEVKPVMCHRLLMQQTICDENHCNTITLHAACCSFVGS